MIAAVITASTSVIIAVLAYLLNQRGGRLRDAHQAELDWVNMQLRDLYGPLLVLANTNETAWRAYKQRFLRNRDASLRGYEIPATERDRWKRWTMIVFAPTAREMRDTIMKHGDLIIDAEMPQVFLDFCSHVHSLDVLIDEWGTMDGEGEILINHPGEGFVSYIRNSYRELKRKQERLRGHR
ncbi:hypothetical protein OG298_37370 [Streptomyces sp. NBC_01005]|uniref:hypothetical protein n=1 Tax=unclassified Streptomyces TaxID=2593676 RepID=UPI00386F27B3|nr:hypothetical protein OG298_37370 [Streptomyces sp. NBC_01005]WTC99099.1 hypothetical protein OH736_37360 [Streptomyces sp. NBC_01650]